MKEGRENLLSKTRFIDADPHAGYFNSGKNLICQRQLRVKRMCYRNMEAQATPNAYLCYHLLYLERDFLTFSTFLTFQTFVKPKEST